MPAAKISLLNYAISALFLMMLTAISCQREVHQNIGLENNKLKPCPGTPNCVVSLYPEDDAHFMDAWPYTAEKVHVVKKLVEKLNETKEVKIMEQDENYLHAVFTIPVFGFKDDVEFFFPPEQKLIHFRSASRVGHYDMGVNKRRMNTLRKVLIRQGTIAEK